MIGRLQAQQREGILAIRERIERVEALQDWALVHEFAADRPGTYR
jgi:hypothetical protein